MADNPLVATAPQTSWTGTANMKPLDSTMNATTDFEGAGLFSDAASTINDVSSSQGWKSGAAEMDIVGDGLDALGVAIDPFGSLLGAGIGWLIEHIGFLKKPLDYLAGDPEEVTAKQQTWENIAKALNDAAARYKQSAQSMAGANQGAAVSGVNSTADNFTSVLTGAAGHASDAATAMKVAGIVVGTTRGMIRDSLSQFAGDAIVKWIAATAAAFFTFGATEAAFVVDEVAEGASLAAENAGKVSKVVQALEKLKGGAKDSSSALEKASDSIAKDAGKDVTETAGKDATETAAKDAGRTKPNDTGETTTTSSASDTGATAHTDDANTAPSDTSETPDSATPQPADTGATAHTDDDATAPTTTAESTTPSSADTDTSAPTSTPEGDTAPKTTDETTTPSSEPTDTSEPTSTPDADTAPNTADETTPSSEPDTTTPSGQQPTAPKEPTLDEKVEQHKQALDDHNSNVAQHNQDAADFRQQSADHNSKAIENDQAMSANKHARDMNQQAMNRAKAQGKPHDDLKAQHRDLEAQHKDLKNEDTRLSDEQKQLESRHEELNKNAADINANAKKLHETQSDLQNKVGDEWLEKHSLKNENVMDNKFGKAARWYSENLGDDSHGIHNLSDWKPKEMLNADNWKPSNLVHHGIPGVPKPTVGDAFQTAKEGATQGLSDQGTREDKIQAEYQEKLEEAEKSGGEQHAWPTAEQSG
ncbi:MAG TPA: hypothetical protein VH333_18610 [Pseudonocardiaceae bacterium]|nr:hypothetical protein [Pseudonocardiaceae bacterium]